jgi:hypothetical protein
MHNIQLWSDIGGRWVDSVNPLFMGGMDLKTARARVRNLQAAKWQIVNKHGKVVGHGYAGG